MLLRVYFQQTYDWNKATQEMILSSFFLGYSLAMFPMGLVVQRLGGKIPIQIGLLVNGAISIITPTVAVWVSCAFTISCRSKTLGPKPKARCTWLGDFEVLE